MSKTPAKTKADPEGCAASSCYGVRRIRNGYLLELPQGNGEGYLENVEQIGKWFADQITMAHDERRHFEWPGGEERFSITFGHDLHP